MESVLVRLAAPGQAPLAPAPVPTLIPQLWRDPHSVPTAELGALIRRLEQACAAFPDSPDLRTGLGMAYAMNHEAYKSMDALDEARHLDPDHFWAQVKFAELMYRLRALPRAEQETLRALDLAEDRLQIALARNQLQLIRRLLREGTQKPAWTKPIGLASLSLVLLVAAAGAVVAAFR